MKRYFKIGKSPIDGEEVLVLGFDGSATCEPCYCRFVIVELTILVSSITFLAQRDGLVWYTGPVKPSQVHCFVREVQGISYERPTLGGENRWYPSRRGLGR